MSIVSAKLNVAKAQQIFLPLIYSQQEQCSVSVMFERLRNSVAQYIGENGKNSKLKKMKSKNLSVKSSCVYINR